MNQRLSTIFFVFFLIFYGSNCFSQQCTNRFSSIIYRGISFDSFTCAITTRTNEILTAGSIDNDQGFVAKFSSKGTPLFSYQYYPIYQNNNTYYKTIKYFQALQVKDGGFVLAGNTIQSKWVYNSSSVNLAEYANNVGVLLKTDAFGNPVWCKRFESANGFRNSGFNLSITNVLETPGNDFIIYLASEYGANYPNYGRVVCIAADGREKWNILLAAAYDGGIRSLETKRGMFQTRDGTIIIGDMIYQTDRRTRPARTLAASLHFIAINPANGALKWETNYAYPIGSPSAYADITSASELPDGNFIFTTSFVESNSSGKKALRIITDNKGVFKSAVSYQSADNSNTQLLSVSTEPSGDQTYLFKTASRDILAKIDATGAVVWTQGLANGSRIFPANCMTVTATGYAVLASNFNNRNVKLLLTDKAGVIDCVNESAQITVAPFMLQAGVAILIEPNTPDQNKAGSAVFPMRVDTYPFQKTIECEAQASCCKDVIDSTNMQPVNICEGGSYTLPDNTVVRSSGTYYVVYKTQGGCDSFKFYRVIVHKNPSALTLGSDICFEGKDSITLSATPGYDNYYWMNAVAAPNNEYKIAAPGVYHVRVTNSCGSKTDSISVFKECDFPIYIPSAFSPNNDGKNDVFKIPSVNRNKLTALKVFNRWGQVIFHTTDAGKGWDGSINHMPQANGVYIYFVEMNGLSGKKLTAKGTVLLVR